MLKPVKNFFICSLIYRFISLSEIVFDKAICVKGETLRQLTQKRVGSLMIRLLFKAAWLSANEIAVIKTTV